MAEKAGELFYDIEMDVRGLLTAQQQVNTRLDLMERKFNDTGKAVESVENSMGSSTTCRPPKLRAIRRPRKLRKLRARRSRQKSGGRNRCRT